MRFVVEDAVGKNVRHRPIQSRMILTPEARAFMESVALHGLAARNRSPWPRNVFAPKRVRLSVDVYNTKHDAAAVSPLVADALEGVLYANDRVVSYGAQEPPMKDEGVRRVEIAVELLESYSAIEAEKRLLDFQVASMRRLLRKRK